jgi:integrase
MATYIEWMEQTGKVSAYDASNTIENHIKRHEEQWNKPANELTLDDVLAILEPLTTAGMLTTARKARAYIRRAYTLGLRARKSAQASAFRRFQIAHNPAADSAPIEGANKVRDIALSLSDLRAVWKRASLPDEPAGPLVRAYLLLGGQRFEQLRRATVADVADERLTLWDSKGKRTQPRRHVVPILPEAQAAIDEMRGAKLGPYLVTLTQGESGADRSRTGKMLAEMACRMVDAGEITARFTLGALRSTVETQLAAAGVQSDTLAQLQSHGLSGVQWRHYNRHDYHAEKLAALKKLRDLMTQAPAVVSSLDEARKAEQ